MNDDYEKIFSDFPILQSSIICQDVTTNLEGQRTYHNELLKIPQTGVNQLILVQIWRGNNTTQGTFYEIVELIEPDGEVISTTKSAPFQMFGPSYRHYNFFAYMGFKFPKRGTYEFQSKLYLENCPHDPLMHTNSLIVT